MRIAPLVLVTLIAAGCAGSRPAPDEPVTEDGAAEQETAAPGEPTGPAVADPEGEGYTPAPDAPAVPEVGAEEAPAESPPPGAALPPVGNATWIAPEIRTLTEKLNATDVPPSAVYYAGGTHAGGCLELYTFRFFYGDKTRYADVAGFERLDAAESCQQIVRERGEPVPERIGVFLIDFSDAIADDAKIQTTFMDAVGDLPVGTATAIPRDAEPYGAEPGTVVRRRQPPPAG